MVSVGAGLNPNTKPSYKMVTSTSHRLQYYIVLTGVEVSIGGAELKVCCLCAGGEDLYQEGAWPVPRAWLCLRLRDPPQTALLPRVWQPSRGQMGTCCTSILISIHKHFARIKWKHESASPFNKVHVLLIRLHPFPFVVNRLRKPQSNLSNSTRKLRSALVTAVNPRCLLTRGTRPAALRTRSTAGLKARGSRASASSLRP